MAKGNSNTGTNLSKKRADSLHRDLKADHELANSPSCVSKWTGERLHNEKHSAASTSQTLGYIA